MELSLLGGKMELPLSLARYLIGIIVLVYLGCISGHYRRELYIRVIFLMLCCVKPI